MRHYLEGEGLLLAGEEVGEEEVTHFPPHWLAVEMVACLESQGVGVGVELLAW